MSDLNWHYSEVSGWRASVGRVNFCIGIDWTGTFLAVQYVDGDRVGESRWKTLDQAKDWCNRQRIGGES
jgi:hypothetical protein